METSDILAVLRAGAIMLRLEENMQQLYVCCGYVDMRKGIEGLETVIKVKGTSKNYEKNDFCGIIRSKNTGGKNGTAQYL